METELVHLTPDTFERVTIGEKFYRFTVSVDEIVFRKLIDPNSRKKSKDKQLTIKNKEILFVRKHRSNVRHPCCNSQHRYSIVSDKHLTNLSLSKEFPATISDTSGQQNSSTNLHQRESGLSLGIYHVLRVKNYRWRVALLVCNFTSEEACDRWHLFLSNVIAASNRPKRLLIFVNPFGGKGRASIVYKNCVEPILKLCDIGIEVITTKRANHAREVVLEKDLREFDGIASVGGDGLFNEVLNGLLIRTQIDSRVDINNKDNPLVIPRCKLAAIPAGSTNALAFTVHGTGDPLTAVLHMTVGDSRGVDVCGVYCGSEFHRFACTSVAFGFLGDVLKDSEELRHLGPTRYLVSGVKVVIRHPWYKGRIEIKAKSKEAIITSKAVTSSSAVIQSVLPLEQCHSLCDLCKLTVSRDPQQPKAVDIVVNDGDVWEEEFLHLVGVVTPCVSGLSPYGLSPTCHLGDGNLHLVIVSRISRMENCCFISKVLRGRNASHLTQRYVKLCEVTEFSFTPNDCLANNNEPKILTDGQQTLTIVKKDLGTWNIDGELLSQPNETIYFKMHRQLITMFARGIEREESSNSKNGNGSSTPPMKLQTCMCCVPV